MISENISNVRAAVTKLIRDEALGELLLYSLEVKKSCTIAIEGRKSAAIRHSKEDVKSFFMGSYITTVYTLFRMNKNKNIQRIKKEKNELFSFSTRLFVTLASPKLLGTRERDEKKGFFFSFLSFFRNFVP